MPRQDEISATMAACLAMASERGKLVRYVGGYWSFAKAPRDHNGHPTEYFGTSTVDGLVKRKRLAYCEYQPGRKGEFPIAAKLVEAEADAGR